jgi:uncharacterized RDD family membrane protein YckC
VSTGLGSDDLVTGEAVALDLPAASVGLRVASGLIDVGVELVLLVGCVALALTSVSSADDALVGVAGVVVAVLVFVALPATLETLTRGRSVGKLALGLRTVRDDAGPISFRHAFTRALVGFVEIWVLYGVPALVCALVNPRGKRVGDLLAGTYVVRTRFPRPVVRLAFMPPTLAPWAGAADMAPLPDALALAVRQFLDRAGSLDPASRAAIGTDLADRVLGHVAPPPPPGQHPETVLAAVLAERRRRDADRLARETALRDRLAGRRRTTHA